MEFSFDTPRSRNDGEGARAEDLRRDPDAMLERDAVFRGRGQLLRIPLDRAGFVCALVRHYRRGGWLGRLLGDRYWGAERFFEEARVTERARALGVATPVVLGVRAERVMCRWCRGDFVTREITGGRDLAFYWKRWRDTGAVLSDPLRSSLAKKLGELVRRMHDAGIVHADLNVKNLLVRIEPASPEAVEAFVVDLDKARILPSVPAHLRAENILRLYRSLEKEGFAGSVVGWRDRMGFLRAYCLGRRQMARELAGFLRRGVRGLWFHRVGWSLSRLGRPLRGAAK